MQYTAFLPPPMQVRGITTGKAWNLVNSHAVYTAAMAPEATCKAAILMWQTFTADRLPVTADGNHFGDPKPIPRKPDIRVQFH